MTKQADLDLCRQAEARLMVCARCDGRFPPPGIARNGRIYCCDKCAAGPDTTSMIRALGGTGMLMGAAAVAGWLVGRRQL